jgi:molecular chaperone HtpG
VSSELHTTAVDLEGLLTVLGAHLYSTPLVAVREVVQNAHDSIVRRRIEDGGYGDDQGTISVEADAARGLVTISDDGSGLTADEIRAYLATIGAGYTRALRTDHEHDATLIGQFGLGFLSAFVISDAVTVVTASYQEPGAAWRYHSTTGEAYVLAEAPPMPVGTRVELQLRDQFRTLASAELLRSVLRRYCCLLNVAVVIAGDATALNAEAPPWRVPVGDEHPTQTRRRRLEFAKRFETTFEPVCTLPVEPVPAARADRHASDAVGVLWIQGGATYGTSDNRNLSVFVRGMLLDDDARDLLPYWAGFVGGVIESNALTPTASREDLQRDEIYAAVREALTDVVITGLAEVARTQPEAWRLVLARHNEALLGAALVDQRLFELVADVVKIPTSQGDLTMPALRKAGGGRFYASLGTTGGFEEMLFRALKVPVARGDRYAVVPFLRRYVDRRGGALVEVGTAVGDRGLFRPGELGPDEEAWLTSRLVGEGEELVPAHFAPPELPLVVVPDREAELKARLEADEADRRIAGASLALARQFTNQVDGSVCARLYLNLECPAVGRLRAALATEPDRAENAARLLRSVKVLLGAGALDGDDADANSLSRALDDVGSVMGILLDADAPLLAPSPEPRAPAAAPPEASARVVALHRKD